MNAIRRMRALAMLLVVAAAPAAAAPLVGYDSGAQAFNEGAHGFHPVRIDATALDAAETWLDLPDGSRITLRHLHEVRHDNGDRSWVGTVETRGGLQSAVITIGTHASFGHVPHPDGHPLRLWWRDGRAWLVTTSPTALAARQRQLPAGFFDDARVPPQRLTATRQPVPEPASAANPAVIDLMVLHSSGMRSAGQPRMRAQPDFPTLTRINHLVALTNQAYIDSGIHARLRLVRTQEVDYPDTLTNNQALNAITSSQAPHFSGVGAMRDYHGADLVALLRPFVHPDQGSCGVAWMPSSFGPGTAAYGYSVSSDGSSGGWFCHEHTFPHEIGHNLGSNHNRANAGTGGAFGYSYGLLRLPDAGQNNGFSTIMSYPVSSTPPVMLFSAPGVVECRNQPCGVADSEDNARSHNLTAPAVSNFRPTADNPPLRGR